MVCYLHSEKGEQCDKKIRGIEKKESKGKWKWKKEKRKSRKRERGGIHLYNSYKVNSTK